MISRKRKRPPNSRATVARGAARAEAVAANSGDGGMSERVAEYLAGQRDAILDRLCTLIRFPSVSTDPAFAEGMRGAREFLLDRLRSIGLTEVRLLDAPGGQPAIFGAWTGAGPDKPTIMIYGHYDVQPADPLELWHSPPFEPTIRDGRLYARGASDDKGQFYMHIKAVEALGELRGKLPVNVKFLIEGEEEIGGASISAFVPGNKERLKADVALVSDTALYADGVPTLCIGLRGLVYT